MLEEYLQKYVDTFNENFPIFFFIPIDKNEVIETIKECLKTGKPFIPAYNDNASY